ncbi:phosphatase PAP2 family protein [Microbacterium awajiense]|uniref:phosphatase PAP2 family protein n=1 Tax=Microbacterium awajiense TaxID=415214 RepID=UPI0031E1C618
MTKQRWLDRPPVRDFPPASARARIVALGFGLGAAGVFLGIFAIVAANGLQPLEFDLWWRDLLESQRTEVGVFIAFIPAFVGGTVVMVVIPILVVAAFFWRRRRWSAVNMATAIIVVVAIGAPLSYVVGRERPEGTLAEDLATSFPSGHTAVATTFAITLALLLRRWYVTVAGVLWIVFMMWGRTYLSTHWLSDVFGGLFEGIAVSLLVWAAIETWRASGDSPASMDEPSAERGSIST